MKSLKNKYYFWRQKIRYKKFKNCSLPYPFWDKKRDTVEWVYFDEYRQTCYEIETSLYEAPENVSGRIYRRKFTYLFKSENFRKILGLRIVCYSLG